MALVKTKFLAVSFNESDIKEMENSFNAEDSVVDFQSVDRLDDAFDFCNNNSRTSIIAVNFIGQESEATWVVRRLAELQKEHEPYFIFAHSESETNLLKDPLIKSLVKVGMPFTNYGKNLRVHDIIRHVNNMAEYEVYLDENGLVELPEKLMSELGLYQKRVAYFYIDIDEFIFPKSKKIRAYMGAHEKQGKNISKNKAVTIDKNNMLELPKIVREMFEVEDGGYLTMMMLAREALIGHSRWNYEEKIST